MIIPLAGRTVLCLQMGLKRILFFSWHTITGVRGSICDDVIVLAVSFHRMNSGPGRGGLQLGFMLDCLLWQVWDISECIIHCSR